MAGPAEIANDLEAQAVQIARGRLNREICETSLRRGAATIRELAARVTELEAYIHGQH